MGTLLQDLMAEFWARKWDGFITRDVVFPDLENKIKVFIGMRRSGKTWLLYQKIKDLLQQGTAPERILYINFEDDRLTPFTARQLSDLIDDYYTLYPDNHKRTCYFFFDEIQNVENWPQILRRLLDTTRMNLWVSGSSAKLLGKEIHTALRGRTFVTENWPFSFPEFLKSKKLSISSKVPSPFVSHSIRKALMEYLHVGGFPEVLDLSDEHRRSILQDYVKLVTFRDIVERYKIGNITVLQHLIKSLLTSIGAKFTVNKFYRDKKSQGLKLAKDTVYEYLQHLEDAYFLFTISLFTVSERKKQVNPKKVYAIDMGLVMASSWQMGENNGPLFENLVFIDLKRKGFEIFYYVTSDGYEIDFVACAPNGKCKLFQVCYDATSPKTLEREERALHQAQKELGLEGILITSKNYPKFCHDLNN
jgi:predicted AAA+ superfamily ATPase